MERMLVAGLIIRNARVLLVHNTKHGGLRIEPPGGKVHPGEAPEESVRRELYEEVGLSVAGMKLLGPFRTESPEGEFIVLTYICDDPGGEPVLMEPEKISAYGWYSYRDLLGLKEEGALVPNMCGALTALKGLLMG